ncbi:MAG: bifunctional diaminohydroxyphosphoribosylaminopyrimidine deaminase/5-amino-6-(5-phosphoribosylamino)uracil reductase RibD, partial [Chlorobi bacterium]|nr:bifunctional diaminohydroxyphosphoribosylaminopyrimidine deaminase/5-amino-6-(5-phosphoribosylamino)uracil reductase RibD [Chlorobiota bacterium]
PPCTDAIIATKRRSDGTLDPERGIRRVVVGMRDPNLLAGGGVECLRDAGIEVVVGVREHECQWLNRFFTKHVVTGMPYVIGKAAISFDGCIATATGQSQWITCEESRRRAHVLRAEADAVLVGRGTVTDDDPQLSPRLVRGRMPRRIVLDTHLSLPLNARMFSDEHRMYTIVCTALEHLHLSRADVLRRAGITVIGVPQDEKGLLSLDVLLHTLGKDLGISSVLVEGGSRVLSGFISAGLLDELHLFVAPMPLGNGVRVFGELHVQTLADTHRWRYHAVGRSGDDVHMILLPHRSIPVQ